MKSCQITLRDICKMEKEFYSIKCFVRPIVDRAIVLHNDRSQQTRLEFWAVVLAVWQRQYC